jgi:hypothetical protein
MSDEELMAEIERRKRARDEVEGCGPRQAASATAAAPIRAAAAPRRRARPPATTRSARPTPRSRCPPARTCETVKKSYRRLMRKYHPDLHVGTPRRPGRATDLTQRLTQAYKTLEKHLRR